MTKPTFLEPVNKRVQPLRVQPFQSYLPNAFDDELTIIQKINKMLHMLHEYGKITNEMLEKWNEVYAWITGEGLTMTLREIIEEMVDNGELADIINEYLFRELNKKIDGVAINSSYPPIPLDPLLMDGVTDETEKFQAIMDYMEILGGGTLILQEGTLIHTRNFIPNNVIVTGKSKTKTIIKLKDSFITGKIRLVAGLYTKYNIDYFSVQNLTYDGNAENNVNLSTETNYDSVYAHGILNTYIDPDSDPYQYILQAGNDRVAKDFLIENVHIKNTVRNSLLLGGRTQNMGTVNKVHLENAYLDHYIYESGSNATITYNDITTSGTFRGAGMVLENGNINNLYHINPKKHPNPNLNETAYFNLRNSKITNANVKPIITNAKLDLLFNGLHAIIIEHTNDVSYTINNMVINQKDTVSLNIYNAPFVFILGNGGNDVSIDNLEFNNIMSMTVLYITTNSDNYHINNVKYNFNSGRSGTENDHLVTLRHTGSGTISNLIMKNIISNEKSPSLINFSAPNNSSSSTFLLNILFDNIILRGGRNKEIFKNVFNFQDNFTGRKNIINNSLWSDFQGLGNQYAGVIIDKLNFVFDKTFHNQAYSNTTLTIPVPSGQSSVTVPYNYIMRPPKNINVYNLYDGSNIPTISIRNLELTATFKEPVSSYTELYITLSYS